MRTTLSDLGGWSGVLAPLTRGIDLPGDVACAAMADILAGDATPAQVAGFIVALRMKGETLEELSGLLDAMIDAAEVVTLTGGLDGVLDTCGTGGDRSHSINVSTLAAVVAVGAGARVCKHGNRAASSACGSADLLEALGVRIDLDAVGVARCVEHVGFGFCFAPRFHPAMRHAVPTRRELGVPTVFNMLGPLANPAGVRRQVVGVADPAIAERMARVLAARGAERALVVHGHDGLDELTTTTTSSMLELIDGDLRETVVDPAALGLAVADPGALRGGDPATNAGLARAVLSGECGPHRDVVALNAAAGLLVGGVVPDLAEGIEAAYDAIDSGRAASVVDALVAVSNA
jgi:anthranilate phosphoribosyltransferase